MRQQHNNPPQQKHRFLFTTCLTLVLGLMAFNNAAFGQCPLANIMYVKKTATGLNNGTSWANAFTSLQTALSQIASCPSVNQIWVAKGTYKPSAAFDQTVAFVMKPNVNIYGSFAGTEANLADRTPSVIAANPTILSGDLVGNDVISGSGSTLSITGNAENSYHVLVNNVFSTSIRSYENHFLDGFTITGGNTHGDTNGFIYYPNSGGGIYDESHSDTTSNLTLNNLTFVGNAAESRSGGLFCDANIALITNNLIFSRNHAGNSGGGLQFKTSSNYLNTTNMNNTVFSGNNSNGGGGGISAVGLILNNVTFWGNNAGGGGGMLAYDSNIKNSIFWGNTVGGTTVSSILGTGNVIINSDVQGGFMGTGNINENPLFVNTANPAGVDGVFGTADDGLALTDCSPALNIGNNSANTTTTDIASNPRVFNTTIDLGAYEFQANSAPACSPTPASGLNFDGTNDYVVLPDALATAATSGTGLTIAYWFKGTSNQSAVRIQPDGNTFIIAGWNGFHVISNDGGISNGIALGAAATDGNWHHIAVTWKQGGNFTSYLDGVQVASRAVGAAALPVANSGMTLGSLVGVTEFTNGNLDEVRVFNVALSQTQIQNTMNCELPTTNNVGLLGYYKFNKGTSYRDNTALNATLPDASGFAYNGTLTNFTLTGTISNWIAGSSVTIGNTCSVALPIELLSFEGKNTEGGNLLTWTTASEVNNKGFDVERLTVNSDWGILGFVKGNGQGSTYQFLHRTDVINRKRRDAINHKRTDVINHKRTDVINHKRTDVINHVSTAADYYRLRQIDNDGKETFSKVISIQTRSNDNKLKAYPNPVSNVLTIETEATGDYQIINILGQIILRGLVSLQQIDVSALSQGNYVLKVGIEQVKFIKQ